MVGSVNSSGWLGPRRCSLPALVGSGPGRGAGAGLGGFVGGCWCAWCMPRRRDPDSPKVVYRTARAGLRLTRGQRRRLIGLLVSAGDVWACVLELNAFRRARQAGRWRPTRNCAACWPPRGRARSGNSMPPGPGRCCAATPAPGSRRPNAAAAETPRRGFRAAGGGWCRCAGTTARTAWTGGCCRFRWPAAARRCRSAWTATCPTRPRESVRSPCCTTRAGCGWR